MLQWTASYYEGMRIINTSEIMDENSLNGAQNVGVGQNRSLNPAAGDKIDDANGNAQNNVPQYTIPGILHFIEHEWQRFQAERSQWDTDRAELQVSRRRGIRQRATIWVINRLEFAIAPDKAKQKKFSFSTFFPLSRSLSLEILSRPSSLHLTRAFIELLMPKKVISCYCVRLVMLYSRCDLNI